LAFTLQSRDLQRPTKIYKDLQSNHDLVYNAATKSIGKLSTIFYCGELWEENMAARRKSSEI